MDKKGIILCYVLILSVLPIENKAQDTDRLLNEARQLESAFHQSEALQKYLEILRYQSGNLTALCKVSELYSILGNRQATRSRKKEYYTSAKNYGQQALQVNANNADANFVMAMAMGRMALISSGEEKIKSVREIKTYAEKCVQLDPANYKGYHVLGKWHYEVSDLNTLEKWLVKVAYGALPKATLEDAIRYYEKCRQLNPAFVLNYLELAKAYHRKDNDKQAIVLLEYMLKLPDKEADDAVVKKEAKELLEDLK